MYRSAENNLSPLCNITLVTAHESYREFWLFLLVATAESCHLAWCSLERLVRALHRDALQQHAVCWSDPGQSR